jgi:hypothetical protein
MIRFFKTRRSKATAPNEQETYIQQIAVNEQREVLSSLIRSVARPGFVAMEVGSWCGDSAVEFGKVAKEVGGILFCIDWWRGSVGTNLETAAEKHDVFNIFWNRVKQAGLDDVIIPIRGRSDDVAKILGHQSVDLLYIDGDHRYQQVKRDIATYSNFVKPNGVLCGDDCEGRLSDYPSQFINSGLEQDYFETVHCGVVKSVAESFAEVGINYNIWSVKRSSTGWEAFEPEYAAPRRRQYSPPLMLTYKEHNFVRYGRYVYGLPFSAGPVDVSAEHLTLRD